MPLTNTRNDGRRTFSPSGAPPEPEPGERGKPEPDVERGGVPRGAPGRESVEGAGDRDPAGELGSEDLDDTMPGKPTPAR